MYSFASLKVSLITEKGTDVIPGRELRSHKLCGTAKRKRSKAILTQHLYCNLWVWSYFCYVVQPFSRVWLCDPKDCSTPGFPCPSPSPRACSNSCPLSHWCHPTISSSAVPVSPCLQSFSASRSFPVSRIFASGG